MKNTFLPNYRLPVKYNLDKETLDRLNKMREIVKERIAQQLEALENSQKITAEDLAIIIY